MMSFVEILRTISIGIIRVPFVLILIILGYNFYKRNKRITVMQKLIIGKRLNSPIELTISEIVLGIFAGVIGSVLISLLGVGFSESSMIDLLFLLTILNISFNSKYMEFAYTASMLGFLSLLVEIMEKMYGIQNGILDMIKMDIASLMTLVAVFYLMKGFLILIDGSRGTVPIFTKRDDKIIGGFALKRYWAIPFAVIIFVNSIDYSLSDVISVSIWQNIINFTNPMALLETVAILLLPLYGLTQFDAVTFTKTKREKTFIYGTTLIIYSLILFILARLCVLNIFFQMAAIIFAPVAYEFFELVHKNSEIKNKPKFISDENGIMVLEVAPDSPAWESGIKSGDILIEINNKKIVKEDDVFDAIKQTSNFIWLKIKKATGKFEEVQLHSIKSTKVLGVVLVPTKVPEEDKFIKADDFNINDILEKIKNRKK
ncbi:PDZ domain-containing protein [Clostridium sp. DL1XJH146]